MSDFIREQKYAYFSLVNQELTVNGSNGFFTTERMNLDTLINTGLYEDISKALAYLDIDRITIHESYRMDAVDSSQVDLFREWIRNNDLAKSE